MIEEEGVDLAAQHLRGIQVDGGWLHVAVQHLQRVREEILIVPVGGGIGDGEHRRVAVPAPGAADALDETGLVGRNAPQHHAGQGADVDAHLQGRRRREQVLVPGLRGILGGHEAVLQGDPLVALQQPRVLVGDDPGDVASRETGVPPVLPARGLRPEGLARAVPGRQSAQCLGGLLRHPQCLGAGWGDQPAQAPIQVQPVRHAGRTRAPGFPCPPAARTAPGPPARGPRAAPRRPG